MLIKKSEEIPYSAITSRSNYLNRRAFVARVAAFGAAGLKVGQVANLFEPAQRAESARR